MKDVIKRLVGIVGVFLRMLGWSVIGSVALAGVVALRHALLTPQPLDSPLPGEAHLYRWKRGHIYYKVAGAAHEQPMVLLHTPELAGSAYEMLGIMEPLAANYRVYAPDLPGFGLSDRPNISYTADLYTELLRDFLVDIVKEPATIVASRLSCNYAISVAANSPELCTRLVLLSPTALYGYQPRAFRLPAMLPQALPFRIIIPRQLQVLLYPLLVAISSQEYNQTQRLLESPTDTVTGNQRPDYIYATTHQFGAAHAAMDWLAGNLVSNVSADIQKVRQLTLLIWGTGELQDAQQGHAGRRLPEPAEVEPGGATTRVVLLQRTHSMIHRELPETVVKTILKWSAEPAISEAKTSTSSNLNGPDNETGTPGTIAGGLENATKPQIEAYCMKCKQKRGIIHPREVTMKNGRIAVQGACEVCGASLFRMGRLAPGFPQTPI